MSENQNNTQNYEEETDLREIIMLLWRKKVLIISFTLILAILAGTYSMFIISPVYETRLNIVMSMPETYVTQYGEYKLPITSNKQYIDLITSKNVVMDTIKDMGYESEKASLKSMRERITIDSAATSTSAVQNSFIVTVKADNSEESLKLAETLYHNYIEYMDTMIKERAIKYFNNKFTVGLETAEDTLDKINEIVQKNETLLSKTPQLINQNEALEGVHSKSGEYIVIENIINPTYTDIETVITQNKQIIISTESDMNKYNQALEELAIEQAAVDKYQETGRVEKFESTIIEVVDTSVYLSSMPSLPTEKSSPSNGRNVVIGGVLGGMLGVMIVFFAAYWKKEL